MENLFLSNHKVFFHQIQHICIYKKQISTRKTNTQLKAASLHVLIRTKIIHPRAIKSLLVQESCAVVLRLSQQRPKEMFRKFTTGMKRSFLTPYMHFSFFFLIHCIQNISHPVPQRRTEFTTTGSFFRPVFV